MSDKVIKCPECGEEGHQVVYYKGFPLLMCPKAEENKIKCYDIPKPEIETADPWLCPKCGASTKGSRLFNSLLCPPCFDVQMQIELDIYHRNKRYS